jgi:hypothetical protein
MELFKEELSFFFHYMKGVNRKSLKEALDKVTSLEELEQFKEELDEFYSLMPGEEDIESYTKNETYKLLDVRNPDKSKRNSYLTTEHIGGDPAIIRQSHAKKKWYYELLENRINELKQGVKSLDNQEESNNNDLSFTKEDIYNFLSNHFKIDVRKENFLSEDDNSFIVLSGKPKKLYRNELTLYLIGALFEFFFENLEDLGERMQFEYKGQRDSRLIDYSEAIYMLGEKRREIEIGKSPEKKLKVFLDNIKKELKIQLEKDKK